MVAILFLLNAFIPLTNSMAAPSKPTVVGVERIWDRAPHNAFTDLIRFRDRWFCTFREGKKHWGPGASGNIRVITSSDGKNWQSTALFSRDGDLRDPKLSIHPDGRLMVTYQRRFNPNRYPEEHEYTFMRRSENGSDWTAPKKISNPDSWLWRVTWHEGLAYGIEYSGVPGKPPFSSRQRLGWSMVSEDGHEFQPLADMGYGGEATVRFRDDDTALCLYRGKNDRGRLGVSQPPYTDWQWSDLNRRIGGPNMIQLPDGRWIAAVRLYDDGTRTSLCRLDPDNGTLNEVLSLPSAGDTGYAGLVWHDNLLWVSYYSSHEEKTSIYLARVRFSTVSSNNDQ